MYLHMCGTCHVYIFYLYNMGNYGAIRVSYYQFHNHILEVDFDYNIWFTIFVSLYEVVILSNVVLKR